MWVLVGVAVLLLFVVGWVGIRGFLAKGELEAALPILVGVQQDAADGDFEGVQEAVAEVAEHTSAARSLTSDPVWGAAAVTPFAGANLHAFGEIAAITDTVVQGALAPATSAGLLDASFLKPVDGRFDLSAVGELQSIFEGADAAMVDASARLDALDTSGTIGPIQDAHTRVTDFVEPLVPLMAGADGLVKELPKLLGQDGPRRYLVVFQNNAEARSLGGHAGSWLEVIVDDGRISLQQQVNVDPLISSMPIIGLTAEQVALFEGAGLRPSNTTIVPDLQLSAETAAAYWNNAFGTTPDAVFFQDPVALGFFLQSTPPVTLPDGTVVDGTNAAAFLLNEVYLNYGTNEEQDAVFGYIVQQLFASVTGGSFDPASFLAAAINAGEQHRLLAWFFDDSEREALAGLPLDLPPLAYDEETAEFGLYFTENYGSKMLYYLDATVELSQQVCGDSSRYRVRTTFTNLMTPDFGPLLPWYVGALQDGKLRLRATLYAPPGSTFASASGWDADFTPVTATDGEHPAMVQRLTLGPGQSTTTEYIIDGDDVDLARDLEAYVTPLARYTPVEVVEWPCG